MRPFAATLSFAEALRIVSDAAVPIGRVERVSITEADGRVLARDVTAPVDVPPFERAAMDGYALIAADADRAGPDAPVSLRCVDRVFTGQVPARAVGRGECIEVATGAPMPPGADAVVMVEQTARDGDLVRVRAAVRRDQNIGHRGADIRAGATAVAAGDPLTPGRIGAIAATGATAVDVYARPTVAIASTGNEIVEPGAPLEPGQLYDINSFTLSTVVARHGGVSVRLPSPGDSLTGLSAAVDVAKAHDLIVFSGGSSVGERDLVLDAIRAHGEVIFHGIAVKPGKPTAFGRIGRTLVFGMPGYPTSCLSNAYMLLVPLLRRTARLPPWRPEVVQARLARRVSSVPGRHQFYPVKLTADGRAEPVFKASGDITSMAAADGYIEIAAEVEGVEEGTAVRVALF